MSLLLGAAAAFALAGQSAAGWQIVDTDSGCGMLMEYEGQGATELIFFEGLDGTNRIMAMNSGWSLRPGQKEKLLFWLDGKAFDGEALGLRGTDGKPGFSVRGGADFKSAFAKSASVKIYRDQTVVDDLSLRGSAAALAAVNACVSNVHARKADKEAGAARLAHIPADPFAGKREPSPRGNPGSWVTSDDYPAEALRKREEGQADVRFDVGADGRVSNCKVERSSGSPSLDAATCTLVTRRGRFEPLKDAAGNPTTGAATYRYLWKLGDD